MMPVGAKSSSWSRSRLSLIVAAAVALFVLDYLSISNAPTWEVFREDANTYGDVWSFLPVHGWPLRMLGAVAPVLNQPLALVINKSQLGGENWARRVVRFALVPKFSSVADVKFLWLRAATLNSLLWLLTICVPIAFAKRFRSIRNTHVSRAV
jgi:hypothetical protein